LIDDNNQTKKKKKRRDPGKSPKPTKESDALKEWPTSPVALRFHCEARGNGKSSKKNRCRPILKKKKTVWGRIGTTLWVGGQSQKEWAWRLQTGGKFFGRVTRARGDFT